MKKTSLKFLIFAFTILMMLIPIKSLAFTLEGATDVKDSTYIVPYGRAIGVKLENNETIKSDNEEICKIDNSGKLKIVGTGKFTITSKQGDGENQTNLFAWNVCLKNGKYTVYSDSKKKTVAGDVSAKTYFAVSEIENTNVFKINEHLFMTGSYSGNNLDGNYMSSYYDKESAISTTRNYEYALDNKFDEDDDGSQGGTGGTGEDTDPDVTNLKLGKTYTPNSNESLKWHVSNDEILSIEDEAKGTVRAIRIGKTELIGKDSNGTKKAEIKINVYREQGQIIKVEKIVLSKTNLELKKDASEKIDATVVPSYADNRKVSWVSSNPSVVGVSIRGRVTARSGGAATITASTANGVKATCEVKVETTKPVHNYPVSGKVIKSYKDDTINVSVELIDGFYVSKIWVKNPSTQVKKKQSSNTTLKRTRTVNEILNDTPNAIIGSNASSYSRSMKGNIDMPNGNIIITEGVVKRQWENKTADVILAMLQDGSFKYYRSSPYSDLIRDGVKNTFKFGPILIENGRASSKSEPHQRPNQKAERTCIGQTDANNYIILSTKGEEKTDAAQSLGLKLGVNFLYNADGGGSTTLWFRNKTSGKGTQIKSSGRKLPDTLYFVTEKQ